MVFKKLRIWWFVFWTYAVTPWQHERNVRDVRRLAEYLRDHRETKP